MEKSCSMCKQAKPLTEFNKRAESPDGRTPSCKKCIKARRKGYSGGHETSALTEEQKKLVYMGAILRMKDYGLVSNRTSEEMLDRVKAGISA